MTEPHFSAAAERNRIHIAPMLRARIQNGAEILEIASGTGQHATYFAKTMPKVRWQPTDRSLQGYGLGDVVRAAGADNLAAPIVLDVTRFPDFQQAYDGVYCANGIHVMPEENLPLLIAGASQALKASGMLMLYGPFKYDGVFTTQSNEEFDSFLRGTYPGGGIRDFEDVDRLAEENGLVFHSDTDMPSNNQFIIWRKRPFAD